MQRVNISRFQRREFLIGSAAATLPMSSGEAFSGQLREDQSSKSSVQPSELWPKLETLLHTEADRRAVKLSRGSRVVLDAAKGALAPAINNLLIVAPDSHHLAIPADGLLAFAIDVEDPMYVTGSAVILPHADLRPGLRCYLLCDSTLLAAPMVAAPAWSGVGNALSGPAPERVGEVPSNEVPCGDWFLSKGRHYVTVAGPHFREGGVFQRLEIQTLGKKAEAPVYSFAVFADTHLDSRRSNYTNVMICDAAGAAALTTTFRELREQGVAFVILAGDMVDRATREQFAMLAQTLRESGMPGYGCVGNHDSYLRSSRPDLLELVPGLFPGAATDYILYRRPLRFIVLDGSFWLARDGQYQSFHQSGVVGIGMKPEQIEWLRWALARDTNTPTVVVSHFPFHNRGGLSSCGFDLGHEGVRHSGVASEVTRLLEDTPNVVATLNGHTHWNEVNRRRGVTILQNAAFCEWPCMYRVFRVYSDRMEWEVRQVGNRGHLREACLPEKAVTWAVSTGEGDLAGQVGFSLRSNS